MVWRTFSSGADENGHILEANQQVQCALRSRYLDKKKITISQIAVRSRCWTPRCNQFASSKNPGLASLSSFSERAVKAPSSLSIDGISQPSISEGEKTAPSISGGPTITPKTNPVKSIHRLLLMSYYPSGFWSRLLTRMLADDSVIEVMRSYFDIPKEVHRQILHIPSTINIPIFPYFSYFFQEFLFSSKVLICSLLLLFFPIFSGIFFF